MALPPRDIYLVVHPGGCPAHPGQADKVMESACAWKRARRLNLSLAIIGASHHQLMGATCVQHPCKLLQLKLREIGQVLHEGCRHA